MTKSARPLVRALLAFGLIVLTALGVLLINSLPPESLSIGLVYGRF